MASRVQTREVRVIARAVVGLYGLCSPVLCVVLFLLWLGLVCLCWVLFPRGVVDDFFFDLVLAETPQLS